MRAFVREALVLTVMFAAAMAWGLLLAAPAFAVLLLAGECWFTVALAVNVAAVVFVWPVQVAGWIEASLDRLVFPLLERLGK